MGRRKIEIEFIREDRSRATTFIKRKSGLFKKAHELAILTGAQVAVVVFSQQERLFTYSNEPCINICSKYLKSTDAYETKGPQDYSTTQEHEDESDEEDPSDTSGRKGSISGPTRKASIAEAPSRNNSPPGSSRTLSRKNSIQLSPRLPSPKRSTPSQRQGEFGRAPSPGSTGRKRTHSPVHEHLSGSPKLIKHEQIARDFSDVRSSPAHHLRASQGSTSSNIANRSMMQGQEFSNNSQMSAPMLPPHPSQVYPQLSQIQDQRPGFAAHPSQQTPHQRMHPQHPPLHSHQQDGQILQHHPQGPPPPPPGYAPPSYKNPPNSGARSLSMAPPLQIPSNMPMTHQGQPAGGPHSMQEQQRNDQPLLPAGISNSSASRVLLPGESNGHTPIESPGNFASSLYASNGISTIGTNVPIPRISTDVGSLFYNWNTNEPGLSPATSMALGQYRENNEAVSGGNNPSNLSRSQLSAPPISAGVLENFSPTTAQWLSGHSIPPAQTDGGRPY